MRIITLFIDSEPIFEIEKTINRFMSLLCHFMAYLKHFFGCRKNVTIDMLHIIHVNKYL